MSMTEQEQAYQNNVIDILTAVFEELKEKSINLEAGTPAPIVSLFAVQASSNALYARNSEEAFIEKLKYVVDEDLHLRLESLMDIDPDKLTEFYNKVKELVTLLSTHIPMDTKLPMYGTGDAVNNEDLWRTITSDGDGEQPSLGRWLARNGDNLFLLVLSGVQFAAGIGMMTSGWGTLLGSMVFIQGGANATAQIVKIIMTTEEAFKNGDTAADALDAALPDSFLGLAAYLITKKSGDLSGYSPEEAGAWWDVVDCLVGLIIVGGSGPALKKLLGNITPGVTRAIIKNNLVNLSKLVITVGGDINSFTTIPSNLNQIKELNQ